MLELVYQLYQHWLHVYRTAYGEARKPKATHTVPQTEKPGLLKADLHEVGTIPSNMSTL